MRVTAEQLINGLIRYADGEVINSLPTSGKWLLGASIGLTTAKINDVVYQLNDNTLVKTMGIVDENGLYDTDLIFDNLKESASKYGKLTFKIPLIGDLTFSDEDVATLKNYIERG